MSEPVLQLLIFYGGLAIFAVAGLGYALFVYRRGRSTATVTAADFGLANARAEVTRARFSAARAAWFDDENGRVVVELETGLQLSFRPNRVPGLEGTSPEDLREMVVSPSGLGLHLPRIDADVYLPALLGTRRQHSGNR
ncbi:DUF2442 domain-containing protein [Thiobacillus sedimenti]|uniref:DUF2442 domain-containing protein n=1 Tax=Thiobacillus sedimenti TaxID=3110231 RepID=A0ABZ1CLP3_9PROT|nr:DUF2442 domain-containing protein [Thiobacillus sp. SCUT-2]WRS39237.1 DUF2442 domain-containing protein [Thiobacillus sp. SCUT-2]